MLGSLVFDLILVLVLITYIAYGWRKGFTRSVGAIAGVVLGTIAAYFVMPLVANWVSQSFLRIIAVIVVGVGLVLAGHAAGSAVGRAIRRTVENSPLGVLDRILGAITTGVVAALVASMLAFSVGSLGVPVLSQAIGSSWVIRAIDSATPDPIQALLARLRALVIEDGIPRIVEALGVNNPGIPNIDTGTDALNTAAQSVVRISGTAFECGQSQTGSGFVVADDRVVTNAHVVAGVGQPVVETPGGGALTGIIVYFDPVDDLAVIAVDGLNAPPLPLSETLAPGTAGAVQGYPFGGPFSSIPAEVISVSTLTIPDIYGESAAPREVYTLATGVEQGNSGGPLLSQEGEVAGVIFAKGQTQNDVGYAMTMTELQPVVDVAPGLNEIQSSGSCTPH
jgi:S1-C subfamily serine protease